MALDFQLHHFYQTPTGETYPSITTILQETISRERKENLENIIDTTKHFVKNNREYMFDAEEQARLLKETEKNQSTRQYKTPSLKPRNTQIYSQIQSTSTSTSTPTPTPISTNQKTNTKQYNKIIWYKPEIYLNSKPNKLWRLNKFIEIAQFKKGEIVWIYNNIENRIVDYGTIMYEINEKPNNIINDLNKIMNTTYDRQSRTYTIQVNNKKIDLSDEYLVHGAELAYFS